MKRIFLLSLLFVVIGISSSQAQRVRVRIGFPAGIRIGAPGPVPYAGAIWVGPEWQWRGGQYHSVAGYWARPNRYNAVWVTGHWKYIHHGYRWVPGHWR